jgi:prepilin-type N-terminal cleavage/methylation domain-containing protein
MRRKKIRDQGFTLLEILVVISLIGLISVTASGFLIVSLRSSSKANVMKEVRQSGSYALSVMEGMILTSASVGCTPPHTINVKDKDGRLTTFSCQEGGTISSSSANLTSASLTVTEGSCNFSCDKKESGFPTKVHIEFVLQKGDSDSKPNESASIKFETEVLSRNID